MELTLLTDAADVLESLLDEDNTQEEVWFLLACAYVQDRPEEALECIEKSRELLEQIGVKDKIILAQIAQKEKEAKARLQEIGSNNME